MIGRKIQQLRKDNAMSQEELASKLTISRQAISKWELGESVPDTENVVQLSKLFGVSTDFLLLDEIDVEKVVANDLGEHMGSPVHSVTPTYVPDIPYEQQSESIDAASIISRYVSKPLTWIVAAILIVAISMGVVHFSILNLF